VSFPLGRGARGFTLVELQIVLVLVAMITLLLTGGLRIGVRTWEKVTAREDLYERRFMLDRTLRKQLGDMRFITVRDENDEQMTSFLGGPEQVHFVAPFPGFQRDGSLFWWTLRSTWNAELQRDQLVLDYRPFLAGQVVSALPGGGLEVEDQPVSTLVVAEGVRLTAIDYFRRDPEGVEEWLAEWPPLLEAPQVVRLQLAEVDREGEEVALPEIALVPRFASQLLYDPGAAR